MKMLPLPLVMPKTNNLRKITSTADILITAVGKEKLITDKDII